MKTIISIILILSLVGCNTHKKRSITNKTSTPISVCPDDGICTFNVLKNKKIAINKDEFGNSYSKLTKGNKTVLKFEYTRNTPKNLQDASYNEIIYIEINSNDENIELYNSDLQKVNLIFGRLCFCRGQTGYYKITQGYLKLHKINNEDYHVVLNFKTDEVPQIITAIDGTFKL